MTSPTLRSRARRSSAYLVACIAAFVAIGAAAAPAQAAQLAAVNRVPGAINVFARDPATGGLRESHLNADGSWSAWFPLGGSIAANSGMAAISRTTASIDVFYLSTAGAIIRKSWSSTGGWTAPITMTGNVAAGGPNAAITGSTVQLITRSLSDGTALRHAWNPASNALTTHISNFEVAPSTAPAIGATSATEVQLIARDTLQRGWLASFSPTSPPTDLTARRTRLPGTLTGSPAITSQSTGSTHLFARLPSGEIGRLLRSATTAPWPTAWTALPSPPATQAPGSSPATLAFKPNATAAPVVRTYLPTTGNTGFVEYAGGAWKTITPGGTAPTPPIPNAGKPSVNGPEALPAGTIRYFGRTRSGAWDSWFQPWNTPAANRTWLNSKIWRLEMFNPSGDPATSWFSGGMVYGQLYTIEASVAAAHPNWIMRDTAGNPLYASDGQQPHNLLAGNIFDASYRAYQVERLTSMVAEAQYRGLWLDNVNLELGDSGLVKQLVKNPDGSWNSSGQLVGAITGKTSSGAYNVPAIAPSGSIPAGSGCTAKTIPAGGTSITDSCWAVGIAALTAQVRAALPAGKELLVNTPWYRFQRDVETYRFKTDASGTSAGRPTGGLPTVPGQSVVDSSTYADLEGAYWHNGQASGTGPGGSLTGHSSGEYSLDMIFRWVDAVHAKGKGVVADNWDAGTGGGVGVAAELPLRLQEFNLAGYLLTTNGKDGIGDYDLTNTSWPAITGSGGTRLYDLNIGAASALPAGVTSSGITNGRGVATIGSAGSRLWVRAFTRSDAKKVYVLLHEPGSGSARTDGSSVNFTLPVTGCSDMTHAATAPASYASLNPSTRVATLKPRSAMFVLC